VWNGRAGNDFNSERNDQIRALFAGTYSAAGALVGTELMAGALIDLLRNQMFVAQMGARFLSGLTSNVSIPRQTGGATASWLAEDATGTATNQAVGQLNLTPHRLFASTSYTEQLVNQASVDVENFVRQDLMTIIAIERDRAALNGSGVSGEPVGIINLGPSNLSTQVTLSAAQSMTYANAVQFETNLAVANADRGKLGYMTTPTVRGRAKLVAEISSTNSVPVWKNNEVNGYPARATNQVPTATSVIFGNWDDLILAEWANSSIFVDPYSLSMAGQIRVINRLYCDNGVRHGKSFAISVDS
jgi:HK97 family phage major capsid protein